MGGEINRISQAIGRIEQKVDDLSERFDCLPCSSHQTKIDEFEAYKNKALGIFTLIGLICGLIGWFIAPLISYLLDKSK